MQTLKRSTPNRPQTERDCPPPPARGLRVRTQIRVGPSNYYDQCETCKSKCNDKPPEVVEGCRSDCEVEVCDYP